MKLPCNYYKGFIANAKKCVRKFITDSSPHHIIPRRFVLNFIFFLQKMGAIITHFNSKQRCRECWKFTELSTWVITYTTSLKYGSVLFYPLAHVLGVSIWNYETLSKWMSRSQKGKPAQFVCVAENVFLLSFPVSHLVNPPLVFYDLLEGIQPSWWD